MIDDLIDKKLQEDVKKLFDNNSTNILNVNDVFDVKEKLNIKIACNEIENIYPKLLKSKKEAQIILNLYNAHEIYKNLKVLRKCDLENSCKEKSSNESCSGESTINEESSFKYPQEKKDNDNLNCTAQFEKSETSTIISCNEESIVDSHYVDKPEKSTVIYNLSRYIFYFLIAKHLEVLEIFKSIPGNESLENVKCTCCDAINKSTDWQCTTCEDSLLSFYEAKIYEYENKKLENKKLENKKLENKKLENKKLENEKLENEKLENMDLTSNAKAEPDSQVADKHDVEHLDWTKWKCKQCGFVNENENVNCTVCMEARTEWICKQCTLINEMNSEQCSACETSREDKAGNKDNNVKKEGMIDSWYCWYEKCKKRNYGNVKYCTHCGLDKSANRERGAAVDMNKYGEKQQVWICYKCNHINKDLTKSICDNCFESKFDGKFESKINVDVNKSGEKLQMWTCKDDDDDNNNDNNDNKASNNVKKEGMIDSWYCWYEKCKKRNDGNVKYCTHCGLDKSANRERGATVDMNKYGEKQQVWICCKCYHINENLTKSICDNCFDSKFDVKGESNEVDIASYEVIESDNDDNVNKWKCKQCKSVNGEEFLFCKQCKSSRMEIWSCKQCTMRNKISDDNCVACGVENENKIIKICSKCKRGEIICDELCFDCLRARDEIWTCWYRFCKNKNPENVKYCKHCGLDRYADKIRIGAPMWWCKGDVPHEIWICDKCYVINDVSYYYCQYRTCSNKNKYTKWCSKCEYKYNHESSKDCIMCKDKLGWTW